MTPPSHKYVPRITITTVIMKILIMIVKRRKGNLKNDRGSDEPKCIFTNSRVPNDDHFLKGLCVLIWRERETALVIHG